MGGPQEAEGLTEGTSFAPSRLATCGRQDTTRTSATAREEHSRASTPFCAILWGRLGRMQNAWCQPKRPVPTQDQLSRYSLGACAPLASAGTPDRKLVHPGHALSVFSSHSSTHQTVSGVSTAALPMQIRGYRYGCSSNPCRLWQACLPPIAAGNQYMRTDRGRLLKSFIVGPPHRT